MTAAPRKHHSKVKSGCQSCKARRIKCDEGKPTCRRCGITQRICAYEPPKPWLFVAISKESPKVTTLPGLPKSLPVVLAKGEQLRALEFFRERTTPCLSAFSRFTRHFFVEIIPQVSATEDAVRLMTIGLAARQELVSCSSDRLYELSLVREGAVSASVHELTQPGCSIVGILMCGLLFIGYECLQDPLVINPDTSVRHLGAGLRILKEHRMARSRERATTSVTDMIDKFIEPIYLQMEMMLCIFNTPLHTVSDYSRRAAQIKRPKLPPRFTDLAHARNSFFMIYRWHYLYRAEGPKAWTPTSSAFLTVRSAFYEWYILFMTYNDTLAEGRQADIEREKVVTIISHWSLLMVALVHSTAISNSDGVGGTAGSPYLPHGGRLKTSIVDLMDPDVVTVTFIVDAHSLRLLEICDWTDAGISGDQRLRIWPVAEVRKLEDGSGRGIVKLRMGG